MRAGVLREEHRPDLARRARHQNYLTGAAIESEERAAGQVSHGSIRAPLAIGSRGSVGAGWVGWLRALEVALELEEAVAVAEPGAAGQLHACVVGRRGGRGWLGSRRLRASES